MYGVNCIVPIIALIIISLVDYECEYWVYWELCWLQHLNDFNNQEHNLQTS